MRFVKDLTNLKDTFSPPSACSVYSVHSQEFFSRRAYGIIWKGGNDPLLIAPQTKALLAHTWQIFNHNPLYPSVMFIVQCLLFQVTCLLVQPARFTAALHGRAGLHNQWELISFIVEES